MRFGASLAVFLLVIFSEHAALGQSIEPALDKLAGDSTVLQATEGSAHDGDNPSVENRLLTTDCDVALELVKMAHGDIEVRLSKTDVSPQTLLMVTADLLERLVAFLSVRQELGHPTLEIEPWRRRLTEVKVEIARLEVARLRELHRAVAGQSPVAPPVFKFQRDLELAGALISQGKLQLELMNRADTDHGSSKKLREVIYRLQKREEQLHANIEKLFKASAPLNIDELIEDAQRLLAESNQLVTQADKITETTRQPRTEVVKETAHAVKLIRSILVASNELIQAARTGGDTGSPEAKLRQLMIRRLALLREQFQRVNRQAQLTQTVSWLDVADASQRVLAAELDLCQTRQERIARRQQHLDQFRRLEARLKAAKIADPVDLEVALLRFEIELQRERIRDKSRTKSGNADDEQSRH